MRLSRRTFKNWPAVVLLGILAAAFISARTGSERPVLAVAFMLVGGALMVVGVVRIRTPDWRQTTWWQERPLLRVAFSWRGGASSPSRWGERLAGAWQFAIGLAFFAAGLLVVV